MKKGGREVQDAITEEVAHWKGVSVAFEPSTGGGHPKAKYEYAPLIMRRAYSDKSDSPLAIRQAVKDARKVLAQLGATRDAEPDEASDNAQAERLYRKPNPGREMRPDPVEGERVDPKPDIADQLVEAGAATEEQAAAAREVKVTTKVLPAVQVDETTPPAGQLLATLKACGFDIEVVGEVSAASIIAGAADMIEDGIYFGLPEEVYHAVPRLSASGIRKMLMSPGDFWESSWLNPDRDALDEESTKAQILGKAYHCARLEPDEFEKRYCRKPNKSDFPKEGLLTSDAAVKAELKERGLTQTIGNETVADRAQRLLDDGFEGTIFPLVLAEWEAEVGGRTPIEAEKWDDIVRDMERLRKKGEIAELLSTGQAEVSVFWTERYGLKMKCRMDYLRPDAWKDFKTFDNSLGKVLAQALSDAVRYNRYHVQAVIYREGVEAIRLGGLQIKGTANDAQRALIAAIQMRPGELACWFIFQQKGGVPNLLAKEFPFYMIPMSTKLNSAGASPEAIARVEEATRTKSGLHIRGMQDVDHAKREFILYSEVYSPGEEWAPIEAVNAFSDADFNSKWLEGQYD